MFNNGKITNLKIWSQLSILAPLYTQWTYWSDYYLHSHNWHNSDSLSWVLYSSRFFTVKSFYNLLNKGGVISPYYKYLWSCVVPLKVQILVWLAIKDKTFVCWNLVKRGMSSYNGQLCMFYNMYAEFSYHLFIKCPTLNYFGDFCKAAFDISSFPSSLTSWWALRRSRKVR